MGFDIYTGTLGSGKSLDATLVMFNYLFEGKSVVCNYPINEDEIKTPQKINMDLFKKPKDNSELQKKRKENKHKYHYCKEDELTVEWLITYYKKYHMGKGESNTLLVIDEASMYFNARTWNEEQRTLWIKFFKHSRKLGFDVIIITQCVGDIDKQIRGLFDYNVIHRKLASYKIFKWVQELLGITFFVKVYIWEAIDKKDRSEFFVFKKKYANLYDTYDMFMDIDEIFGLGEYAKKTNKSNVI